MINKEFNREICFTCYSSWLNQAKQIRELYDDTVALNYLLAIGDYACYEIETEDPFIRMMLMSIKEQIDASQNRRAGGFGRENTEQTKAILDYYKEHPGVSQDTISKALGISKGKVNKVLKSLSKDNNSNNNSNNNDNINYNNNSSDYDRDRTDSTPKNYTMDDIINDIGTFKNTIEKVWSLCRKGNNFDTIASQTNFKKGLIYDIVNNEKKYRDAIREYDNKQIELKKQKEEDEFIKPLTRYQYNRFADWINSKYPDDGEWSGYGDSMQEIMDEWNHNFNGAIMQERLVSDGMYCGYAYDTVRTYETYDIDLMLDIITKHKPNDSIDDIIDDIEENNPNNKLLDKLYDVFDEEEI